MVQTQRQQTTTQVFPNYPPDYIPNLVEIHDQRGLLVKIKQGKVVEQTTRPQGYTPSIMCWYFDGQKDKNIAYLHTTHSILVNRISQLVNDPLPQS